MRVDTRSTGRRTQAVALASRLRMLRESLGLVQQDVADLFQTNRNVPSQWENGTREPSFEHLLVLADFYGVTTDWLLGRDGAEKDSPRVRETKRELLTDLRSKDSLLRTSTPGHRLKLAIDFLAARYPEQFNRDRIARQLLISEATLEQMCLDKIIPTGLVIQRFAQFANLPELWFYQPEPQLEDPLVRYRGLTERLYTQGITPEMAEQQFWPQKRGGRRTKIDVDK